jgi:DNA-binding GntR family transcriptional regulator
MNRIDEAGHRLTEKPMNPSLTQRGAEPGAADEVDDPGVIGLREIVARERPQYTSVGEMVLGVLRQAILTAALAPDMPLRQDKLAELLGVSRMPIRNALLQLEAEGLVTFHAFRGARVRALSGEQLLEMYEIRRVLESFALRRAVDEMIPQRLEQIEKLALELDGATSGAEFAERSFSFYRALYDADRHPILVDHIERLHGDVGRYWIGRRVLPSGESAHATLLEWVRRGDADAAVKWLDEHLDRVATELVRAIAEGDVAE